MIKLLLASLIVGLVAASNVQLYQLKNGSVALTTARDVVDGAVQAITQVLKVILKFTYAVITKLIHWLENTSLINKLIVKLAKIVLASLKALIDAIFKVIAALARLRTSITNAIQNGKKTVGDLPPAEVKSIAGELTTHHSVIEATAAALSKIDKVQLEGLGSVVTAVIDMGKKVGVIIKALA